MHLDLNLKAEYLVVLRGCYQMFFVSLVIEFQYSFLIGYRLMSLQIVSNGRYPSCLHRVVNNKFQSRTSIALFYSPALTAKIKPAPKLVDKEHPPQYVEFTYGEFLKNFYNNGGPNKKVVLQSYQAGQ
jgi:hypothetical protein